MPHLWAHLLSLSMLTQLNPHRSTLPSWTCSPSFLCLIILSLKVCRWLTPSLHSFASISFYFSEDFLPTLLKRSSLSMSQAQPSLVISRIFLHSTELDLTQHLFLLTVVPPSPQSGWELREKEVCACLFSLHTSSTHCGTQKLLFCPALTVAENWIII